jgi:hypothetical protein
LDVPAEDFHPDLSDVDAIKLEPFDLKIALPK